MTTAAQHHNRLQSAITLALVYFVLSFVIYFPALSGEFIFDDVSLYVVENPLLKDEAGLLDCWISSKPVDYLPLTYTTFWIERRLWGLDPTGYHVVNVVLHATSAAGLAWCVRLLGLPGGWAMGLLFLVHPLNVETVAWISQRKTLLGSLFALLALGCYLKSSAAGGRWWYLWACVCFTLSLLGKPVAILLPVFLLIHEVVRDRRLHWKAARRTLPFFLIALVIGAIGVWFQAIRSVGEQPIRSDGIAGRLITAGFAWWFYLGKSLWPVHLCFVYPRWNINPQALLQWIPLLLAGAIAVASFWKRSAGLAVLWFTLMIAPASGLVDVGYFRHSFVADHYAYLALPAVIAGVVWILCALPGVAARTLVVIIAVMFGLLSARLAREYQTAERLWKSTLNKNPRAALAHSVLGRHYRTKGEHQSAVHHIETAYRLRPDVGWFIGDLAAVRLDQNQLEEAERLFREAIALNPSGSAWHRGLGIALARQGNVEQAESHFKAAGSLALEDPLRTEAGKAEEELGRLYLKLGRLDEAQDALQTALNQARDDGAIPASRYDAMGRLYLARRDFKSAHEQFLKSYDTDHDFAPPQMELAILEDRAGNYGNAMFWLSNGDDRSAEISLAKVFFLATCLNEEFRNSAMALEIAESAQPVGMYAASVWDSRAAALASMGRFDDAEAAAKAGVNACKEHPRANDADVQTARRLLEKRAELYRKKMPLVAPLSSHIRPLPGHK